MTDSEFMQTVSRAVDLRVAGDLSASIELAVSACHHRPEEPSAWHTLAMTCADLGKYDEALYARRRAVELLDGMSKAGRLDPGLRQYAQQCLFAYATSRLLAGDWSAETWRYWECGRLGYSWSPPPGTEYWQGQTDGGVLVTCEGGYGDLFLFARFLPVLARQLGQPVGLMIHPGLEKFRDWHALGVTAVYTTGDPLPTGLWKYSTSIMSLPGQLGIQSPQDIPADRLSVLDLGGYVAVRKHVGFCWRSEEYMTKRRFRSLSLQEANRIALPLMDLGPVCSLSPSGKDLAADSPEFRQPKFLLYEPHRMESWLHTAKYIAGMRMVVTVDTAAAHLAGLLGVPTLLLLPLNTDWKWGTAGDTTEWYPTVRLFRNELPLEWETARIVEIAVEMWKEIG